MTDLDQRIASVLREHAEGETDTHRLLRNSRALGRRRQVRRRTATGTALALVGVLGFVGVGGTDLGGLSGRLPWGAATPTAASPVPPLAGGVPGATADPSRVATDARVLHFGVDPARARYLGWGVRRDEVESVRFTVGSGRPVLVEVSRSRDLLSRGGVEGFTFDAVEEPLPFDGTVREVPGQTGGVILSWRPVDGLYARASTAGRDQAALRRAVDALRWNQARRCPGPLRLTTLPPGATVLTCDVDVSAFPGGLNARFVLGRGEDATMRVSFAYASQLAGVRTEGNRTVDGRSAYLYPDGTRLELLGIPKAHLIATFGGLDKGFTEADATVLLAGAQVATDLTDPETWK
ncbi:hypothetical protein FXF50_21120 [Micromonospora sp. AP08]|uniref:hypothetical protein n=1 Tax=Micromonospora sp. AP08 TaxID=2604467 RepID=UPI0011D716DF|nr:hypothetical protein [Micromonospora sp. AP08]TYB35833.1 hypothetical protein FXF50_21120 [Micromonospora sp. AP08]